jgi:hypothetical protein
MRSERAEKCEAEELRVGLGGEIQADFQKRLLVVYFGFIGPTGPVLWTSGQQP